MTFNKLNLNKVQLITDWQSTNFLTVLRNRRLSTSEYRNKREEPTIVFSYQIVELTQTHSCSNAFTVPMKALIFYTWSSSPAITDLIFDDPIPRWANSNPIPAVAREMTRVVNYRRQPHKKLEREIDRRRRFMRKHRIVLWRMTK